MWQIPSVRANDVHEAMFPVELPSRLIRLLTDAGDLVLDCFTGSGTTGLACIRTGRRFVGVEKGEREFALARARLENELRQGLLPLTHNAKSEARCACRPSAHFSGCKQPKSIG